MQLGIIGLGRMGYNMTQRLLHAGHACVVYDLDPNNVVRLAALGATGANSLVELVTQLTQPRLVWMMVPVAAVEETIATLTSLLRADDVLVDGGNSYYRDSMRRAQRLASGGIHFLDVGTSGGVPGLEYGYCLMIGGPPEAARRCEPVFAALAPGNKSAARIPDRNEPTSAEFGYLYCGASGAGHLVKMIHNGIEYGMMAAYAEGFNLLREIGRQSGLELDAAEIAEVWRRGSVIRSWLLDLVAHALLRDPALAGFRGEVGDSGEGRWAVQSALEAAVPVPVLSAALYARFGSRGHAEFADKLVSAMRSEFGGHRENGEQGDT